MPCTRSRSNDVFFLLRCAGAGVCFLFFFFLLGIVFICRRNYFYPHGCYMNDDIGTEEFAVIKFELENAL